MTSEMFLERRNFFQHGGSSRNKNGAEICIMEDFDGSDRGAATPGMRKREQDNRLSVHVQH